MSLTSLLARTYLRYAVVVTLLSLVAFAPLLWLAMKLPIPADLAGAKGVVRTAWLLVGLGLVPLLVLVGGVTPAVRSIVRGTPASQLAAFGAGLAGLVRAVIPCAVAMIAVLVGGLALVVPGLLLLVLLSLTGAMAGPGRSVPAPLIDSVAAARARMPAVTVILLCSIAAALGGVFLLSRGLPIPLPKQPTIEMFANFRLFARWAVAGVALGAPIPAIALAVLATTGPSART